MPFPILVVVDTKYCSSKESRGNGTNQRLCDGIVRCAICKYQSKMSIALNSNHETGTKTEKGSGQNPQTSDHIIVDVFVVVGLVFFFVCSST
jgi:hypothetical protein